MPGSVLRILVGVGDGVEAGQPLVVVEAMKMEHRLVAPVAGTVSLQVAPGDLVRLDQVVARVDADADEDASGAAAGAGAATASTPTPTDVPPLQADAEPARPAAAREKSPQETGPA
jgi:acetyl-CoA/propionyl-CoA carboxylase biotin carboxyl carrier protein